MNSASRRVAGPLLALLFALAAVGQARDAAPAPPRRVALRRDARAVAERLYARLEAARAARQDRALLECAFELVDRYRAFPDNDRVLLFAARAAWRLGDRPLARQLLAELREGWPGSPLAAEVDAIAAGIAAGAAPPVEGAPPPNATGPPAASAAPLAPVASRARLPAEFAPVVPPPPPPGAALPAPVQPGLIGLLCPVTGDGSAATAAAFAAGARLAAAHAARDGWRAVELRVADTAGDPAEAALRARSLAATEGAVALVGPVDAGETVAAVAIADAWRMPLVAPGFPLSPRLRDFGPTVVITGFVEAHDARLLARLAVEVLGRPRAAVLYPDTPEGARACAAFVAALVEVGGRLVATAACAPDGSRLGEAVRSLVEARPEVLFVPAGPGLATRAAELWPSAPTRPRLLGPSAWDGALARDLADSALAGALFPAQSSVWPADWVRDFRRDLPGAGDAAAADDATRLALRGYAAVRLVVMAMSDCGLAPQRAPLAAALAARWGRLRDGSVTAAAAIDGARILRGGRAMPFSREARPEIGGR